MFYKTETEIREIIEKFENATLPHDLWRHAEHLLMAVHYSRLHDFETALDKMRWGINRLNKAHGVVTTNERGYHETLTVFWTKTVFEFLQANKDLSLTDATNAVIERFDRNYPFRFYSRDSLFSKEARFGYVAPDLLTE